MLIVKRWWNLSRLWPHPLLCWCLRKLWKGLQPHMRLCHWGHVIAQGRLNQRGYFMGLEDGKLACALVLLGSSPSLLALCLILHVLFHGLWAQWAQLLCQVLCAFRDILFTRTCHVGFVWCSLLWVMSSFRQKCGTFLPICHLLLFLWCCLFVLGFSVSQE